ncbi:carboxypeptidase regulatory-like domain-containing protein [Pedobacter changchengzhani]|uniref:Carboxypeptidase regulatory-like domain-containing protein n=1 Tax=Pedobacter changchengzhani TaxID=2529274 RepID=A0A4R5MKV4_9SPHI|nr:carboxypeptidase-like regulatory domain-containing protein [Pedobacter changchengzhani]TDG36314.1 carboxypeptidase regulatory-like domain-containing protein [Pedobacter changchengzhani]
MKAKFQITIAEPCNQNWDKMEKRTGENFCAACNKNVIDFSTHSNAEIIAVLNNRKNEICGRLSKSQLNQINYQLLLVPKNNVWMKYLGVLAIGVGLFNPTVMASPIKRPVELHQSVAPFKINDNKPLIIKSISGYVVDENKQPLVGVRVVIQNTKLFALTDKTGRYYIKLNAGFNAKNNLLSIESLRFGGTMQLNTTQEKQNDFVAERSESMIMGKMIMVKQPVKSL